MKVFLTKNLKLLNDEGIKMIKKIKKYVKSFVPDSLIKYRRILINRRKLNQLYSFDKKRYKTSAYEIKNNYSINNLRSKITFHYHSIEKGLSNKNIRLGFGKNAFEGLFYSMDKYIELGYPTEDNRFQEAIAVINQYLDLHETKDFPVEWVRIKQNGYEKYDLGEFNHKAGYGVKLKKDLPDFKKLNFEELAMNRHSIRDFGEDKIEDSLIYDAISIATKTPSVCNRQAYRVYQIKDERKLQEAFLMQGGLTTNGANLQQMLLVTSNREFMNGPHERNQTYIDGGMFTMSLIYGLTYHGIANCALNTNFTLEKEKSMRELLDVPYSEDLIAFIAIGSYDEENKYAKSLRDKSDKVIVTI